MKILLVVLVALFILGLSMIILPIVFPSFCFGIMEKFLDWKDKPSDSWDGS